ncbi:MAG: hypothetical protein LBS35_08165 [Synergistaceae bacterium]|jgi:hypothetical protein|nr:hypothetical protein [Synergistaceae bacterium]
MKSCVPNHTKNSGHLFFGVLFLVGVVISTLLLGSIRIYGFILEHRLAECAMKIMAEEDKYAMLEETHAALLSPSRIYNYARSELNMVAADKTETIKLFSDSYDPKSASYAARGENSVSRPDGLSRVFVGAANAKE